MDKSEGVEGQESLYIADGPTGYVCSATVISAEKSLETLRPLTAFKILNSENK